MDIIWLPQSRNTTYNSMGRYSNKTKSPFADSNRNHFVFLYLCSPVYSSGPSTRVLKRQIKWKMSDSKTKVVPLQYRIRLRTVSIWNVFQNTRSSKCIYYVRNVTMSVLSKTYRIIPARDCRDALQCASDQWRPVEKYSVGDRTIKLLVPT